MASCPWRMLSDEQERRFEEMRLCPFMWILVGVQKEAWAFLCFYSFFSVQGVRTTCCEVIREIRRPLRHCYGSVT